MAKIHATDTGEPDPHNDAPASGAEFPDGWYVAFLNRVEHPLVAPKSLSALSEGCRVVAVTLSETAMNSVAWEYQNGQAVWRLWHKGDIELESLEQEGRMPAAFEEIRNAAFASQAEEGGNDAEVDLIFDIPLALAEKICGYRHDQSGFSWGTPEFTALEISKPRSFLSRILRPSR